MFPIRLGNVLALVGFLLTDADVDGVNVGPANGPKLKSSKPLLFVTPLDPVVVACGLTFDANRLKLLLLLLFGIFKIKDFNK